MKRILKITALTSIALLTGCSGMVGTTSFSNMSSAYRDVLEKYGNDNILLNVARASKSMPVSFLDMPSVMGTGNVQSSVGLSASIYGVNPGSSIGGFFTPAAGSSYAPMATMSVGNSFNFTQSSLDNSSFMVSFLSDMKPEVIASLSNSQTAAKTVLYSLAIESLEAQDEQGKTLVKLDNNPYSPDFPEFQRVLYTLIRGGISVEQITSPMPLSAPMNADEVNKNMLAIATASNQPGTGLMPVKLSNGQPGYQLVKMLPQARICLIEKMADNTLTFRVDQSAYCKTTAPATAVKADPKSSAGKPVAQTDNRPSRILVIKLRSVRNVFDFLGALVNMQSEPTPKYVYVVDPRSLPPDATEAQVKEAALPLFVVKKGAPISDPLMTVRYQGDNYSIPADSNSFTRQVLVLVSQMLTLTKVPGSIPVSPAVLIK
ncbi:hypothetical protein G3I67_08815 [Orrella sp. NBD-18]|uniref:Uncharacterized protein n=1 Tax=Sheuella amnicola TaxID=2707330 RepID=A0A6B2QXY8_9BURK|nr:hypothetical protein [Sheuella amnicola]NDY83330.1 hypothetical protein [Sheuella amnicola]